MIFVSDLVTDVVKNKEGEIMPKKGENVYHRKDGLWEARYVKEIDIYGKKKYGSVYGHSCREAKEKRKNAEDNIRLFKRPVVSGNMTVPQLVGEYLQINKARLKPSTMQRYNGFLHNHIEPYFNALPVAYLNTSILYEFSDNRIKSGLSAQSVNAILVLLHSCMKFGHEQYGFTIPDFIYLPIAKREMRVLSVEEQSKLVEVLNHDMDIYKFGVYLALYTGLRVGELCALQWGDIEDGCIKVRRTMQRVNVNGNGSELYIGTPKTASSIRDIPVPSFLNKVIENFRCNKTKDSYVLENDKLSIVEPRVMQYKFKKIISEAGIEKANFHSLRHSFATRCVECGFDVKTLSCVLGHSSITVTMDRYVHTSFETKLANMEKLKDSLIS